MNNDAPFVQGAAAESLGAIRDLAALPALWRALDHPEADVRWQAASALGRLGGDEAWDTLIEVVRSIQQAHAGRCRERVG